MNRFLLPIFLALMQASISHADEGIDCPINDVNGEDECIHLSEGNIVFKEDLPPKIIISGRLVDLNKFSMRILHDTKPYSGLAGYKTEETYVGKNVTLVVTKVTKRNSCYYQDKKGKYVESESCCGSEIDLTFKVNDGKSARVFQSNKWYGS